MRVTCECNEQDINDDDDDDDDDAASFGIWCKQGHLAHKKSPPPLGQP